MDIDQILEANRTAVDKLISRAEQARNDWHTPRAPGKWSPSQVVEHVARSMHEAARMAEGEETRLPSIPSFLRPLIRTLVFNRVLKKGDFFMKAKTNPEMDPTSGPESPEVGAKRLRDALDQFDTACRNLVKNNQPMPSSAFGDVPVVDYARFMEIHIIHHTKQIPLNQD